VLESLADGLLEMAERFRGLFLSGTHDKTEFAQQYLCGLVQTARPNMERMEEVVVGSTYQNTQQFITDSTWDHRAVMNRVATEADKLLGGHRNSCLLIDESGFTKSGTKSVGVARQYNGRLGKVDNCQVGVCAALSAGDRVVPVDMELYLPGEWTDDPARCRAAGVPKERISYLTKPQMALSMVRRQRQLGVRFERVVFDGLYGSCPELLRGLDADGEEFVGELHCDQRVYLDDPEPYVPQWTGRGRRPTRLQTDVAPIRVDEYLAGLTAADWVEMKLRETTRGHLRILFHAKRLWYWDGEEEEAKRWWLLIRKEIASGKLKYSVSNAPAEATLADLAKAQAQRYWVERGFQDAKGQVGMAAYQVRKWRAWYHHMALVLMAMLFLTEQRMLHAETIPLLSCADIQALLARILPRRDLERAELIRQLQTRHAKRQALIERARLRSEPNQPEELAMT